jgi:hypothetical protein
MNIISPKLKSTRYSPDLREWEPVSFDNLLIELEHIIKSCYGSDPFVLFRGQPNCEWLLDSTFVRNCIQRIFGVSDYLQLNPQIRHAVEFHKAIVSLLLLKFGAVWRPSKEAFEHEKTEDIDPWFELLKNLQQHPERDYFIKGTFLIDWTQSKDIALYFATFEGRGSQRHITADHGAIWVYDAISTGNVLQVKKLGEILQLMAKREFLEGNKTFPLIFHPKRQTLQPRSVSQLPVYVSQMDFRYDLADIWATYENNKRKVFVKIIINENIKRRIADYLESNNISEDKVYPE